MAKFRNANSYLGNSKRARQNQLANLIPGNAWQKRQIGLYRLECFWETCDIGSKQIFYEEFEKRRRFEDVDKGELKNENYIDSWWAGLEIEVKKNIQKEVLSWQTKEFRSKHFKQMKKCLEEKLALLEKDQ